MRTLRVLSVMILGCLVAMPAFAADHTDVPSAVVEPAADINDFYMFMDEGELILIMTVFPLADETSVFSDAVEYSFNMVSDEDDTSVEANVVCTFETDDTFDCSLFIDSDAEIVVSGNVAADEVNGDDDGADDACDLATDNICVTTGLFDDPFFMDLGAFRAALAGDAAALTPFWPHTNFFRGLNVLAIVVAIDSDDLHGGDSDVVSGWVATSPR